MSKRVVTAETVDAEYAAGRRRISAPPATAVVTPGAWDRARALGIEIATTAAEPERAPLKRRDMLGSAERIVDPSGITLVKGGTVQLGRFEGAPGNVQLLDVVTGAHKSPMTAGFMSWRREDSFAWSLDYDEIDLVLDGTLHVVVDGRTVEAGAGDVVFIPKGSRITFATPHRVRVFYVTYPANWQQK